MWQVKMTKNVLRPPAWTPGLTKSLETVRERNENVGTKLHFITPQNTALYLRLSQPEPELQVQQDHGDGVRGTSDGWQRSLSFVVAVVASYGDGRAKVCSVLVERQTKSDLNSSLSDLVSILVDRNLKRSRNCLVGCAHFVVWVRA
jgi:hypothetical protein